MQVFLEQTAFEQEMLDTEHAFEVVVTLFRGEDSAMVHLLDHHTNLVRIEKNGHVVMEGGGNCADTQVPEYDRSLLNMEDIYDLSLIHISPPRAAAFPIPATVPC